MDVCKVYRLLELPATNLRNVLKKYVAFFISFIFLEQLENLDRGHFYILTLLLLFLSFMQREG